jgi:hypothetical protein
MTILFTGELKFNMYVKDVLEIELPKNTVFVADPGGVIHQARTPPNVVDRTSPKPDAVIVTPFTIVEDPKPGKELTDSHIGQTGVGVGVGGI